MKGRSRTKRQKVKHTAKANKSVGQENRVVEHEHGFVGATYVRVRTSYVRARRKEKRPQGPASHIYIYIYIYKCIHILCVPSCPVVSVASSPSPSVRLSVPSSSVLCPSVLSCSIVAVVVLCPSVRPSFVRPSSSSILCTSVSSSV